MNPNRTSLRTRAVILGIFAAVGLAAFGLRPSSAPTSLSSTRSSAPVVAPATSTERFVAADTSSAQQWQSALSGVQLSSSTSDGNSSQNGSVMTGTRVTLHLCPEGRFLLSIQSLSSVSVPGGDFGSLSDTSEQNVDGTWSLSEASESGVTLNIQASSGGAGSARIILRGDQVFLDGQPAEVSRSRACA